jgi:hypothetical protein
MGRGRETVLKERVMRDVLVALKQVPNTATGLAFQVVAVVQVPYAKPWSEAWGSEDRLAYIDARERALRVAEAACGEDFRIQDRGDPQNIEWWDSEDADNNRYSTVHGSYEQSQIQYWIEPWELVTVDQAAGPLPSD